VQRSPFAQKARPGRSRFDRPGLLRAFACRLVGLNRSTFRYQQTRRPSTSEIRRILLTDVITETHVASRGTYGVRRIRAALFYEHGLVVNYKLVRRLMHEAGLSGLPGKKKGRRNLVNIAMHEELVNRNFTASSPNRLWVTDIERHEALLNREEVKDLLLQPVAAGW